MASSTTTRPDTAQSKYEAPAQRAVSGRLSVRVFNPANPVWHRHSFVVGADFGGITDVLEKVRASATLTKPLAPWV